jgi:hypothetical protein
MNGEMNVTPKQAPQQARRTQGSFVPAEIQASGLTVQNWQDGELKVGDPIFYKGDRYWIERAPASWSETVFVCISDMKIDPTPGRYAPKGRMSFHVPADAVTLAPRAKPGRRAPTVADVQRIERQAEGKTDVGDTVAEMLRGKSLDEMYTLAARFLRVPEDELRTKYSHLNNGQQRMNLGNRMRSWEKKYGK